MEEQQGGTEEKAVPTEEGRPLHRAPSQGVLTGVCAGLGAYTRVDPVVWRSAFVMTALAGGVGVLLYFAAWALMRDEEQGPALAEQLLNRRLHPEAVLSLLAAGIAACAALSIFGGPGWGTLVLSVPLLLGLLTARARGVDLAQTARDLPTLLRSDAPAPPEPAPPSEPAYYDPAVPWSVAGGGPVDMRLVAESTGEEESRQDSSESSPAARDQAPAPRHRGPSLAMVAVGLICAVAVGIAAAADAPSAALLVGEGAGTVFLGSAIVIIGTAFLLGSWFGDPRGLAILGILAVLVTTTSVMTDLTETEVGGPNWRPASVSEAETPHELTGGSALLDLSAVPYDELDPGQQLTVDATVGFGTLDVLIPDTVATEVRGQVFLGGVNILDSSSRAGFRVDLTETLEPNADTMADAEDVEETTPATLVLNLRSHAGNVTVNHV
ncbi:PspC domain-containing protein [Spiractinospora alimapuensis]|uniref:PspC domain-containing protein n=1 Tax=Spiractinospora alimapuensis TaxID=2820884 RepID=UPI001F35AAE8|nr:PspC domain-containing protein [Spiractinospora alimapuensis]QVQ51103.1 PspC domain-containing protein [Spiractinospora alimapuensis]